MEELVLDKDFSILVDSIIEGKAPPNRIGYANKEGRVYSIFELFEGVFEDEEKKVKECIETDNFDYEDVAL